MRTQPYVAKVSPSILTNGCHVGTPPIANLGSIEVGAVNGNRLKIVAISPLGEFRNPVFIQMGIMSGKSAIKVN